MRSDLICFDFEDKRIGSFVDDLGRDWFRGTDVCKALELANPSVVINRVASEYSQEFQIGMGRPALYVSEPGLYALVFASKSLAAKRFQRWVFETVLPKLRATGVAMTSKVTPVAIAKEWEAQGKELEELRIELTRLQEENLEQNKTIIHLSRERQKIALADLECAIANKDADRINTLRALSSLPSLSRLQAEAVKIGTYKM